VQSAGRCLGSGCKRYGPLRLWKQHNHFLHTLDQDVEVNVLVLVVTGTCESGAVSSADGEDECWRASGSQAESRSAGRKRHEPITSATDKIRSDRQASSNSPFRWLELRLHPVRSWACLISTLPLTELCLTEEWLDTPTPYTQVYFVNCKRDNLSKLAGAVSLTDHAPQSQTPPMPT
jgi:hypothetical protein